MDAVKARPVPRPSGIRLSEGLLRPLIVGVLPAVLVLVALNRFTAPTFLAWLQREVGFEWAGVAALTAVCFAGGYAAAQRDRALRTVAVALLFVAIYLLDVVGTYVSDPRGALHINQLTWWAVPFALTAWLQAAWVIATKVVSDDAAVAASPSIRDLWRAPWWIAVVALAAAIAAVATIPGIFFSAARRGEYPSWLGYNVHAHWWYWAAAGWAAIPLLGSVVLLKRAWRNRPTDIARHVAQHGWYALTTSYLLAAVAALLFTSALRIWPEAVMDLLLAGYIVWFVILLAEASRIREPRRRSSVARRSVGAAAVIGVVMSVVAAVGLPALRAAIVGGIGAGAWPLVHALDRLLFGVVRPRRTKLGERSGSPAIVAGDQPHDAAALDVSVDSSGAPDDAGSSETHDLRWDDRASAALSPEERRALQVLLITGDWPRPLTVPPERCRELAREALTTLRGARLDLATRGRAHPLRILLNARGHESHGTPLPNAFLDLLEQFAVLPESVDPDTRIVAFLGLVRQTAAHPRLQESWTDPGPPPLRALEAECAERTYRVYPDRETQDQLVDLIERYKAWRAGDTRPWTELETLDAAAVMKERGFTSRKKTQRHRGRRIDHAADRVFESWTNTLERVMGASRVP
jgi:hypothetical protein